MRVGDKPLRRQTRAMEIPPRKTKPRDVQLTRNTPRHRLKTSIQDINTILRKIGRPIGIYQTI